MRSGAAAPSEDPNKDSKTFDPNKLCDPSCGRPFVVKDDTMTGAFAIEDPDGGITTWSASCHR